MISLTEAHKLISDPVTISGSFLFLCLPFMVSNGPTYWLVRPLELYPLTGTPPSPLQQVLLT